MIESIKFFTIEAGGSHRVLDNIANVSLYPTDIFSKYLLGFFNSFLPIAFLATVPAKIITQGFQFNLALIVKAVIINLIFLIISRLIFKWGLSNYSSASS
jgi:ABC-type uncharacterized transport system permease subunit